MKDLRVLGSFGSPGIHSSLVTAVDPELAVIDLEHASFVTPAGLTALAAFAHRAVRDGRLVNVIRPRKDDVANYLARAHLGNVFEDLGVRHNLPGVREHDVGLNLLPLAHFDGVRGITPLADHVWQLLHEKSEQAAAVLHMSLSAMGENVNDHSGQTRGYVAAQITHQGSLLRFSVADSGHGFRKSLKRHAPKTDVHALRLALRPGVSRLDIEGRGFGLSELLGSVTDMGGLLSLRSGKGHLRDGIPNAKLAQLYDRRLPLSVLEGQISVSKRRR